MLIAIALISIVVIASSFIFLAKKQLEFSSLLSKFEDVKKEADLSKEQLEKSRQEVIELRVLNASLAAKYQESLSAIEDQKSFLSKTNQTLKESFSSLSFEALRVNNQQFIELAKTAFESNIKESNQNLEQKHQAIDSMLKPIGESLTRFDKKIQELENTRQGTYSEIKVMIELMKSSNERLQRETSSLVGALKTTHVRGKYGEIGLRRVIEFSGMSEFCDFEEQTSFDGDSGKLRPDLIIRLPNQRNLILDAKVPLGAYMDSFEAADDNQKARFLKLHCEQIRDHLKKLASKSYWSQFDKSPDYVIMYLQIESSFAAALEIDRNLIEYAMDNRIIFATPTTLITLLKTISFSWQQNELTQDIIEIRKIGVELYNRVNTLLEHGSSLGKSINAAAQHYNRMVKSWESRLIPQVRKLKEYGRSTMSAEVNELAEIEIVAIEPTPIESKEE